MKCDEGKDWKVYRCWRCNKHRVSSRLRMPPGWIRRTSKLGYYCKACRRADRGDLEYFIDKTRDLAPTQKSSGMSGQGAVRVPNIQHPRGSRRFSR